jgi:hypothetical protein
LSSVLRRERLLSPAQIESEHEVTLHADACALATELRGTPVLVVYAGERGAREGGPLRQCTLPADELARVEPASFPVPSPVQAYRVPLRITNGNAQVLSSARHRR